MSDTPLTASALQRLTGLQPQPQPPVLPLTTPVVLMHGFGIGASFRRGGHLHDEAMHLRSRGVRAFAPNVSPYDTVAVRARMWEERFAHILEATRADELLLVGHSMGGLDARYLISERGWHRTVSALVTVSTPHRGSSVAHLMLDQPPAVRSRLAEMADWVGTYILEDGTANVLQALTELTPAYMTDTFNPAVPDHPAVDYASFGFQAGKGTSAPIDPIFRLFNRYIYEREGENDGIVSVKSARWGTYLGTKNADHGRQVGMSSGLGTSTFDANAFYASIVERWIENGVGTV
jgi:triacylglycerol lipase